MSGAPGTRPVRSAATARSTSWWPFSQTSRPGESTRPGSMEGRVGAGAKCADVDARIGDDDALGLDALEQEAARAHARWRRGRGRSAASVCRRQRPLAGPAIGREEGDGLPDRQHEPEAEPLLEAGGLRAEPGREVGRVHDLGAVERLLEAEVAVADGVGERARDASGRQSVAGRAHACERAARCASGSKSFALADETGDVEAIIAGASTAADPTGSRCSRAAARREAGSRRRAPPGGERVHQFRRHGARGEHECDER